MIFHGNNPTGDFSIFEPNGKKLENHFTDAAYIQHAVCDAICNNEIEV